MTDAATVLAIENDREVLDVLADVLGDEYDLRTAHNADAAIRIMTDEWVQAVFCRQGFCCDNGHLVLDTIAEHWPDATRVVLRNGHDPEERETELAFQVLQTPLSTETLKVATESALEVFRLKRQHDLMAIELQVGGTPSRTATSPNRSKVPVSDDDGIVRCKESPMNEVCDRLRQVAPFDLPVLITGESGTGKELAARALHDNSLRWQKPFIVENCGALPDELLESELFGYRKGAFTGAVEDRIGLFERATGGTVFLDEIGEISAAFQVKLLRVLQEQEIRPLGAAEIRKVDVRVIAATNRNLEEEVAAGRFREDLYYRLSAVTVEVPALRDRDVDIEPLAKALLRQAVESLGKPCRGLSREALDCMQRYSWPGNVRELQNEIQRMLVESQTDIISADLLSSRVLQAAPAGNDEAPVTSTGTLKSRIQSLEARILRESLIRHRWNKSRAARELGLSRVGLRSKLERYGLEPTDDREVAEVAAI